MLAPVAAPIFDSHGLAFVVTFPSSRGKPDFLREGSAVAMLRDFARSATRRLGGNAYLKDRGDLPAALARCNSRNKAFTKIKRISPGHRCWPPANQHLEADSADLGISNRFSPHDHALIDGKNQMRHLPNEERAILSNSTAWGSTIMTPERGRCW